ncbi:dihydrolipoamide acetyltransferase family protein [Gordonia sp. 'Campus']|uniref:dihydrolipoamide acetyltransferase family protein n=1 Tax=Gordonia sp. 'Campus' TaxID=2915824 RepID=UPI001EE4B465|nr:dihydrolipoamide acetyltransferase family protein [Gordonia sp. 'Campus']
MSTINTFHLPDLGEGLTEADLVTWTVGVGDTIELNQVIAEVETAKASVELPSPYAGTVVALHAAEGDTIDVGRPIIDIDTGGEPVDGSDVEAESAAAAFEGETERVPVLVGYGVAGEGTSRRRRGGTAPRVDNPPSPDSATRGITPADAEGRRRPLAKPPVRFLAKQNGVDLAAVTPTGRHGEVTRADVTGYLSDQKAPPEGGAHADADVVGDPTPATPHLEETRTPIKGVRKHTAAAMVSSAFTAPHVTEFVTIDITETLELLDRLRAHRRFAETRLTPLALISKALLIALRANPSLNSHWDEDAQEIVTKHYVNLGIAAATPRGLMVPNIKGAERMSLHELAGALVELTTTAKSGKTPPADLAGGTITITNVGVFGVDSGTPILNPGEAAILCVGAIRRQPWEHQGEIALRSVTTLSLSFDHRLVDGEQGSRFLADIGRILSDPFELIALG